MTTAPSSRAGAAAPARDDGAVVIHDAAHLRALRKHAVDAAQPLVQFISFARAPGGREQ